MRVRNVSKQTLRLWNESVRVILAPGDLGEVDEAQAKQQIEAGTLSDKLEPPVEKVVRKKRIVKKKTSRYAPSEHRSSLDEALR